MIAAATRAAQRVRAMLDSVAKQRWFPTAVEVVGWMVVVGLLAYLFDDFLSEHLDNSLQPSRINDDVRQQIPPFYRYYENNRAFDTDYIYTYYLDAFPIGYHTLYMVGAKLGVDPQSMSAALPHALNIVTATLLALLANRFGGKPAAFALACLWLGGGAFHQLVGGLPRAFAFPIGALLLLGLTLGRPWIVAAAAIIGAGFYPMSGVLAGVCLALWFVLPRRQRGKAASWTMARRVRYLVIVGGLSLAVLLPAMRGSGQYGDLIRPYDDIIYPEAGPKGRLNPGDRPPFRSFVDESSHWVRRYWVREPGKDPLFEQPRGRLGRDDGEPFGAVLHTLIGLSLFGWIVLMRRKPEAVRVSLLLFAAFIVYTLAKMTVPSLYLPPRYPKFSIPLLWIVVSSVGALGLAYIRRHTKLQHAVCSWSLAAVVVVVTAGAGDPEQGLTKDIDRGLPMLEYVAELDEGVLIAGMPRGPVENIPYFSRRPVLLTRETHQAFHHDFLVETRARMFALIDAYYATDPEPIRALMDTYGVTHIIVRRSHFRGDVPKYHAPFRPYLREARTRANGKFHLLELAEEHTVFKHGGDQLVDLRAALGPS